jgi:Tfp pilus assembly protein FimT
LAPLTVNVTTGGNGVANVFFASSTILPVTLLNFTGQKDNGSSLLNWSTAQEQNSDRFEIERSADNINFSSIGQVTAAHNSTRVTNYSFTDAAVLSGNNYYRLRMVDLDGKYTYSKVVLLNFAGSLHVISAYPNPAKGSLQLKFSNMSAGRYEMSLVNATGQIVLTRRIQVGDAINHIETVGIPAGTASGTYVIRVVDPQQSTFLTRVVVQ